MTLRLRILFFAVFIFVLSAALFAAPSSTTTKSKSGGRVTESARAKKRMASLRHRRAVHRNARAAAARTTAVAAKSAVARSTTGKVSTARTSASLRRHRRHRYVEVFTASSFADDITEGDVVEGEDPVVRQAAI